MLAAAMLLAGCTGVALQNEKDARRQLQTVAAAYHVELPALTTNSSLADFVRFATLRQPAVAAAYFDWSASIERITQARSLPDPQLTFQADIQDIITSIMPGVLMNFPGPGKLRAAANAASAGSDSKYYTFASAVLE
ncbi:MAG: TolC family protein, partial [Bryobacteraceae bacterium]